MISLIPFDILIKTRWAVFIICPKVELRSTKLVTRNFLRQKTRCAIRQKTAALIENGFRACKSIKIHAVCSMLPESPLVRESLSFNDFFQNEKKPQE